MAIPMQAIEANSTEYGDRQTLEEGLQALQGGGPMPSPDGGVAPPSTTLPAQGSPFSALLSGEVKAPTGNPLSAGLSVGPGSGPANGPTDNDVGQKLKMILEQSSSPTLRRLAYMRLRAMQRAGNRGT